jgi:1-acyl-sn-glycerol-3-phosphate acyltransferase
MPSPVLALPPAAPRKHGAFGRWFGRFVLHLGGWRMEGEFPDLPKMVILAAPHSSAWDGLWGLAAKLAMGVDVRFMAKAELFRGPLGWLLRWLGGMPINRRAANGVVGQLNRQFAERDRLWLAIAPEGTRRRVERWRSGFWHIARGADAPVLCAYFHYPRKVIGIGALFDTTDDLEADMARIRAFYRPWVGKRRGTD